jgi:hypothetical protein
MKTVDQKIQALAMADPMMILDMYCKNIDDSLKKDVIKLYQDHMEVSTAILNAMLIFILKYKDGYIPHYTYMASALKQWLKHVETPKDALLKLTRKKSNVIYKKMTPSQKVSEPDWMKSFVKDLEAMETKKDPQWVEDYYQTLKDKEKQYEEN